METPLNGCENCEYKQKEINELKLEIMDIKGKRNKSKFENAKLRECVEFYADSLNYSAKIDYKGMHYVSVIGEKFELGEDNGKRARQVLRELDEKL